VRVLFFVVGYVGVVVYGSYVDVGIVGVGAHHAVAIALDVVINIVASSGNDVDARTADVVTVVVICVVYVVVYIAVICCAWCYC